MTTKKKATAKAQIEAQAESVEAAPQLPAPEQPSTLKSLVINVDNLTLGDLEFMEELAALEAEGKQLTTKKIFELFVRFFEGWTEEDCRQIKINQVAALKQALFSNLQGLTPKVG